MRERFFTPRLRFKRLDELNAWLLDKCIAYAKAYRQTWTLMAAFYSAAPLATVCRPGELSTKLPGG